MEPEKSKTAGFLAIFIRLPEDHACVPKRLPTAGRHFGVQARALPVRIHYSISAFLGV